MAEGGGGLDRGALCCMLVLRNISCYVADDQLHRPVIHLRDLSLLLDRDRVGEIRMSVLRNVVC